LKNKSIFFILLLIFGFALVFVYPVQAHLAASDDLLAFAPPIQAAQPQAPLYERFHDGVPQLIVDAVKYLSADIVLYFSTVFLTVFIIFICKWIIIFISYCRWQFSSTVGPIQIEEIPDQAGLATLMRQTLGQCGANFAKPASTSAPSATPGFTALGTVLSESAIPKADFIAAVIALLDYLLSSLGLRKYGYIVSCVASGEESKSPVHFTIEIKLMQNKQLKKTYSLSGKTYRELAVEASYWIYWYLSGQKRSLRSIPPWYRFPTSDGFLKFKKAQKASAEEKVGFYKEAIKEAPLNALALLSLGDYLECSDQYLDALELYIKAVLLWPHLYGIWYRIGAVFSCPAEWQEEWRKLGEDKARKLENLIIDLSFVMEQDQKTTNNKYMEGISLDIENCEEQKSKAETNPSSGENKNAQKLPEKELLPAMIRKYAIPPDIGNTETCKDIFNLSFYYRSKSVWLFLINHIDLMFSQWLNELVLSTLSFFTDYSNYSPYLAKYYWNLIPLGNRNPGNQFRRSVEIANYCTDVETYENRKSIDQYDVNQTNKLVDGIGDAPWSNQSIQYNAACYYALLAGCYSENDTAQQSYEQKAVDYLKIAMKDSRSRLDISWVRNDPDLKALRGNSQYIQIFGLPDAKVDPDPLKQKIMQGYLLAGAKLQVEIVKTIPTGNNLYACMLVKAEDQAIVWQSVVNLLTKPDDKACQAAFCRLINRTVDKKDQLKELAQMGTPEVLIKNMDGLWNKLQAHAEAQLAEWKKNLKNSKLFLRQDKSTQPNSQLSDQWNAMEKWQWLFMIEQVELSLESR
jgi:hypothetical protein